MTRILVHLVIWFLKRVLTKYEQRRIWDMYYDNGNPNNLEFKSVSIGYTITLRKLTDTGGEIDGIKKIKIEHPTFTVYDWDGDL